MRCSADGGCINASKSMWSGSSGEIGGFSIVAEGSVSAGVRRLEAVTGHGARQRGQENEGLLRDLGALLKAGRGELLERVRDLLGENRELRTGRGGARPPRDLLRELEGFDPQELQGIDPELVEILSNLELLRSSPAVSIVTFRPRNAPATVDGSSFGKEIRNPLRGFT